MNDIIDLINNVVSFLYVVYIQTNFGYDAYINGNSEIGAHI